MFPLAYYWLTLLEVREINLKSCFEKPGEEFEKAQKLIWGMDISNENNLEIISSLIRKQIKLE